MKRRMLAFMLVLCVLTAAVPVMAAADNAVTEGFAPPVMAAGGLEEPGGKERSSDLTITFYPTGGKVSPATKSIRQYQRYGDLPTPTRSGYAFAGWSIDPLGNGRSYSMRWVVYSDEQVIGGAYELNLYAIWVENSKARTVRFNGNGGTVPCASKVVENGSSYGKLPFLERAGYRFDGWYTSSTGGEKVTMDSTVNLTATQTLYAHWTSDAKQYVVEFDPNGGTVYPTSKTVTTGLPYGTLPVPTRSGYTFLGWFTKPYAVKITEDTIVNLNFHTTLEARWAKAGSTPTPKPTVKPTATPRPTAAPTPRPTATPTPRPTATPTPRPTATPTPRPTATPAPARTFTVSFHGNGGTASQRTMTVSNGKPYGALPTATRSGYQFDGWYTEASGGSRVTASTNVSLSGDQTLYAHWTASSSGKTPDVPSLTYSFSNSYQGFGYPKGYRIPLERYKLFFSDVLSQTLYNSTGYWGGNCFGMSTTASMFFIDGNGVDLSSFQGGVSAPGQLGLSSRNSAWGLNLQEFIEGMQVSQYSSRISRDRSSNFEDLNGLVRAVQNFKKTGLSPVTVDIFGSTGGHSVMGYDVVEVDATHCNMKVYDCNFPGNPNRVINLTRNSAGTYTGWYYHLNDSENWGTGYPGSRISYVRYSEYMGVWNSRNGGRNVNLLNVNSKNAQIKDAKGNVVASIRNGELITDRDDIYPVLNMGITTDGDAPINETISLWLPTDEVYSIVNESADMEQFEVAMANVDQSAVVSTTSNEVYLAVVDSEELNYAGVGSGSSYQITMTSALDNTHADVCLTGVAGSDQAFLSQVNGQVRVKGVDADANLRLDELEAAISEFVAAVGALDTDWTSPEDILNKKPSASAPSFTDMPSDPNFVQAIQWAVEKGVTNGIGNNQFGPNKPCTRGQIVTFLWSAAGKPESASTTNPFVDVKANDYFYQAVLWASENGIVSGTDSNHFSPAKPCTRAQAVTLIWRFEQMPQAGSVSTFQDVPAKAYYAPAVDWALERGITSGIGGGKFGPDSTCTRGQIVTFLFRDMGNM